MALAACFLPPALTTFFRETAGRMDTPRVSAFMAIGDSPSHVFVDAGVHCAAALRLRGGARATQHSSPVMPRRAGGTPQQKEQQKYWKGQMMGVPRKERRALAIKTEHKAALKAMDEVSRMAPPIEGEDEADPQVYRPKRPKVRQRNQLKNPFSPGSRLSIRQSKSVRALQIMRQSCEQALDRMQWLKDACAPRRARSLPGTPAHPDHSASDTAGMDGSGGDPSTVAAAGTTPAVSRREQRRRRQAERAVLQPRVGFVALPAWNGPRSGYVFKRGPSGVGYYLDQQLAYLDPQTCLHRSWEATHKDEVEDGLLPG